MKRDNRFNYCHAIRQQDIELNLVQPEIDEKVVQESHDPKDAFLRIVYSLDERTKLPTGDLTYLVSDKVNPEIKQWVLDNIMLDTSSAAHVCPVNGMSDDDIAALARSPKETSIEYMQRLNDYARSNFELYGRLDAAYKAELAKRQSVPSPDGKSTLASE